MFIYGLFSKTSIKTCLGNCFPTQIDYSILFLKVTHTQGQVQTLSVCLRLSCWVITKTRFLKQEIYLFKSAKTKIKIYKKYFCDCWERVSEAQKAWLYPDGLTSSLAGRNRLHASFWLALIMIYCLASQRTADWGLCVCVCHAQVWVQAFLWWNQSFGNRWSLESKKETVCVDAGKPWCDSKMQTDSAKNKLN